MDYNKLTMNCTQKENEGRVTSFKYYFRAENTDTVQHTFMVK